MNKTNESAVRDSIILIICTVATMLTYILPWVAVDLVTREQITIWKLASILGHIPEYLNVGNYDIASALLYLFGGFAVLTLLFDVVNSVLTITGKRVGIPMFNPSVLVPACFPMLFIPWFLESDLYAALSATLSIWPIVSAVLCLVGSIIKMKIDKELTE